MAESIQDAVEYIETVIKANITLTGSEVFPTDEQHTGNIFCIGMDEGAEYNQRSSSFAHSLSNIGFYIIGSKSNMLQVYKTLEGKLEAICKTLLKNPTLGGTCDTFTDLNYSNASVNIAGIDYVGYKLNVTGVKIARNLTT